MFIPQFSFFVLKSADAPLPGYAPAVSANCVVSSYSPTFSWIFRLTRKISETQSFAVKVEFRVFVVQHAGANVIYIYLVIQKHVVNCKLCS